MRPTQVQSAALDPSTLLTVTPRGHTGALPENSAGRKQLCRFACGQNGSPAKTAHGPTLGKPHEIHAWPA
jgi:hypothetical protein